MKKIVALIVSGAISSAFAAKCNFDKKVKEFEKRMELSSVMQGAKVSKELSSEEGGSSRIQKYSKPIKSGQYMGLRQYADYGFVGCDLLMVRVGKINPKTEEKAAEATVHLRKDGNLKAMCKGRGNVLRVNPFSSSMLAGNIDMEPNPECVCYDGNSVERAPKKKVWCAEVSDFDGDAVTLDPRYIDFVDPDEKKAASASGTVVFDDAESYYSERSTGTRTPKKFFKAVARNASKLNALAKEYAMDDIRGSITLKVSVSEAGEVSSCRAVSSTVQDRSFVEKVSGAVSGWNFGKSGEGDIEVFLVFKVGAR